MAKRGCLPAALPGMISTLALFVALIAALNVIGCCAIDCERFPEECAQNERKQETASLVLMGALVVSAASMGGAIHVRRRGRRSASPDQSNGDAA
jgi:hypothetical protein